MSYRLKNSLFVPDEVMQCIDRLESIVRDKRDFIPESNEQKWKLFFSYHFLAWVYRVTELARDIYTLMGAGRFNTALTCSRPFLEAIAIFAELLRTIERALENGDYKKVALIFNTIFLRTKNAMFLKRLESDVAVDPYMKQLEIRFGFIEKEYVDCSESLNIKTILGNSNDRKNYFENFFGTDFEDVKKHYDILSEYVHSSSFSTTMHYIDCERINTKPTAILIKRYGVDPAESKRLVDKTLQYILSFEKGYEKFLEVLSCEKFISFSDRLSNPNPLVAITSSFMK